MHNGITIRYLCAVYQAGRRGCTCMFVQGSGRPLRRIADSHRRSDGWSRVLTNDSGQIVLTAVPADSGRRARPPSADVTGCRGPWPVRRMVLIEPLTAGRTRAVRRKRLRCDAAFLRQPSALCSGTAYTFVDGAGFCHRYSPVIGNRFIHPYLQWNICLGHGSWALVCPFRRIDVRACVVTSSSHIH